MCEPEILTRTEQLIRENERMRTALLVIRRFAENAVMGSWRGHVAAMVDAGLILESKGESK